MGLEATLFYIISALVLLFALGVAFSPNPVFSALSLVLTMVSLAFVFMTLNAYFIATVQLAVYAGAVAVLFMMVIMLFDLKKEARIFTTGPLSTILKMTATGWIGGVLAKTILMSTEMLTTSPAYNSGEKSHSTLALAKLLFTKYFFAFEILGVLLLVVAIGVVAISRARGGTHA